MNDGNDGIAKKNSPQLSLSQSGFQSRKVQTVQIT